MSGAFHSLGYRDYRLLWSGAVLSNIGLWMHTVALSWYMLELTGSAFWVSAVTFVNFLPSWLSPAGGVLADRRDRRRVLLSTQTLMMLCTVVLAGLVSLGAARVWSLLAITFTLGMLSAVNGPTWQAFVPSLVPRSVMVNAISLNSAQFSMARMIGPAIAGVLVAKAGAGVVFWIRALAYLAVLGALAAIRARDETRESVSRPFASLVEGLRYMWGRPTLRMLIASVAVVSMFAYPTTALLPVYARDVFGRGSGAYGALAAAMGLGSVSGALLLGRRGRTPPRQIFAMHVVLGVALTAFALSPSYVVGLALMAAFGGAYLFTLSSINSRIQTSVDDAVRGRIISLFMLAFGGLAPFGSIAAGAVAEATSVRVPTLAGAVVCALWGAATLAWWHRRADAPELGREAPTPRHTAGSALPDAGAGGV